MTNNHASIKTQQINATLKVILNRKWVDTNLEPKVLIMKIDIYLSANGFGEVKSFTEIDVYSGNTNAYQEIKYEIELVLADTPEVIPALIEMITAMGKIVGTFTIRTNHNLYAHPTHRPSKRFGDGIKHPLKLSIGMNSNCYYLDVYDDELFTPLDCDAGDYHE